MATKQSPLNFLPTLISLISFILTLVILLAGTNNILPSLYYLRTDTTALSVPSKLSSSTFLSDLSAVSGADLVGGPSTSSSLGLADSYTLLLLTSCAHFADGVICGRPNIGFAFDLATDLRLDSTSLQGTFPPALIQALAKYRRTSGWLGIAYVISAALVGVTLVAGLLGAKHRSAGIAASVLATLASLFLFGAGVAAIVVFRGLNEQINAAFNVAGLRSSLGITPVALGFVAFALTLLTAVIFIIRARNPAKTRGRVVARSIGTDYGSKGGFEGPEGGVTGNDGKRPGLWKRIPTWTAHKYVQVGKQPALLKTNVPGSMEAVVVTSPGGMRTRLEGDGDWAGDDEYAAAGGTQKGIAMLALGGTGRQSDANTAYEPYSRDGHGSI